MLDVHPPHGPTHTWRDFLIHIATIVVGLIIALGLEQAAEYFHHREQRAQLREDLREEAERRTPLYTLNIKALAQSIDWERLLLQAALAARPEHDQITFSVPARVSTTMSKPESSVWAAAKASGSVAVLSRAEIEAWDRVDYEASMAEKYEESYRDAITSRRAIADHLGIALNPGASIHLPVSQRDELTRSLGVSIEANRTFMHALEEFAGTSDAVLHGALTLEAISPYVDRARRAFPN